MKQPSYFKLAILLLISGCKADNTRVNAQTVANGIDTTITFSDAESSKLPAGWSAETGRWRTTVEDSNVSLKMTSNDGSDFNIAVFKSNNYQNAEIEAKVKSVHGDEDQGGGLVWRYINPKNYYIIRANPLENNVRLYRVVDGNRKQMQSASTKIKKGEWFVIKVKTQGNRIECYLNNDVIFSDIDDTFPHPGLVGFWSKADAVSLFDDLRIKVLK